MRLILVDPFKRIVVSRYYDLQTDIINYFVQSDTLMSIRLGQTHAMFLDDDWPLRQDQSYFSLKSVPSGALGGYAVITGTTEDQEGIQNCNLVAARVAEQFQWLDGNEYECQKVLEDVRRIKGNPELKPRKKIMIGIPHDKPN